MRPAKLVLALFAAGVAAVDVAAQTSTVTLDEAIRRAERVQPTVVQAEATVRTAGARVRTAWGSYLPAVSLSTQGSEFFSEGPSRIDQNTGQLISGNATNRSINTNINASLDLFTGFRRGADMRAAKASDRAADASLVDARFQQKLTTTNQFFDALAAEQLLRVREASVRRAEEQLKVSIARLQAGAATRSDSLRSLVNLGSARVQLVTAETQLATAEANLARLIGAEGRAKAADDSSFYRVVVELDTTAIRREVEDRSPQVQSAEATARAANAQASAARSDYWPTLRLDFRTGWNGSRLNDYQMYNQRQLALQLNWNVFNGFSRELQVAQQDANADIADANAAEARRQVQADLTTRFAELDAARQRIEITLTSVVAANEDLRVQQERYRLGAATIVDVLTSQEALNQTEVDVVNARFDYLRARARIEALVGRTL